MATFSIFRVNRIQSSRISKALRSGLIFDEVHRRAIRFTRVDLANPVGARVNNMTRILTAQIAETRHETLEKFKSKVLVDIMMVLEAMPVQTTSERRLGNDQ